MKKYFDFVLTGKTFFPVWIIFYVVILIPYFAVIFFMEKSGDQGSPWIALVVLVMMLASFVFHYYLVKLSVNHLKYDGTLLAFDGKISGYLGKVLLGFLLTLITLGIYMAWFTRNIMRYFVNNTSLKSSPFSFLGKGGRLFVILLLTLLPIMAVSFFIGDAMTRAGTSTEGLGSGTLFIQAIVMLVMIPYMYCVYKWMVDVQYKEYHIKWNTTFWASCGQILVQVLLTMITFGIYFPMAYLRLYKYFVDRTVAEKPDEVRNFGLDLDAMPDFLFVWGQTLLTIVTLGIYYPWALAKIGQRFLSKTYLMSSAYAMEGNDTPPPLPASDETEKAL